MEVRVTGDLGIQDSVDGLVKRRKWGGGVVREEDRECHNEWVIAITEDGNVEPSGRIRDVAIPIRSRNVRRINRVAGEFRQLGVLFG